MKSPWMVSSVIMVLALTARLFGVEVVAPAEIRVLGLPLTLLELQL